MNATTATMTRTEFRAMLATVDALPETDRADALHAAIVEATA